MFSLIYVFLSQFENDKIRVFTDCGIWFRSHLLKIHKGELEAELYRSEEAASGLLLILLLLISQHFESAVHASGKFVPNLSSFIQSKIPGDLALEMTEVQSLVVKSLKAGGKKGKSGDSESLAEELSQKFKGLKEKVLAMVSTD